MLLRINRDYVQLTYWERRMEHRNSNIVFIVWILIKNENLTNCNWYTVNNCTELCFFCWGWERKYFVLKLFLFLCVFLWFRHCIVIVRVNLPWLLLIRLKPQFSFQVNYSHYYLLDSNCWKSKLNTIIMGETSLWKMMEAC